MDDKKWWDSSSEKIQKGITGDLAVTLQTRISFGCNKFVLRQTGGKMKYQKQIEGKLNAVEIQKLARWKNNSDLDYEDKSNQCYLENNLCHNFQ